MRRFRRSRFVLSFMFAVTISAVSVFANESDRDIRVMTYNMYLGADLAPIFNPVLTPEQVFQEVGAAFADMEAGNVPERIEEIADQIAADSPDVVGLQEVALWRYGAFFDQAPAQTVAYDFLQILLHELAERGAHYEVISIKTNLDAEVPGIISATDFRDIRYTDRIVILARTDLQTSRLKIQGTATGTFQVLMPVPFLGGTIYIERGWTSADIKHRGKTYRFVNAHTEAFNETVQYFQTLELLALTSNVTGPVILAGDFNSDAAAGGLSYLTLLGGGFTDVWSALEPSDSGLTWPLYYEDPSLQLTPTERLDLILARGELSFTDVDVVGEDPVADLTTSGLRPSDHAGVAATLVLLP